MRVCARLKLARSVSHASTVRDTPRLARSRMLASASVTVNAAASITDNADNSDASVAASDAGLSVGGAPAKERQSHSTTRSHQRASKLAFIYITLTHQLMLLHEHAFLVSWEAMKRRVGSLQQRRCLV